MSVVESWNVNRAVRIELFTAQETNVSTVEFEYLIEYSSTRLIAQVAINYRVIQNEQTTAVSYNFVIRQRFEICQNMPEMLKKIRPN